MVSTPTTVAPNSKNATAGGADDLSELRDKQLTQQITQMRKLDNWTNWRYLATEYLYLGLVLGLGFAVSTCWAQSVISTWLFVPAAILISVLVGIGQHRLVMLGHEASHFALFKSKPLNELASDWLCFFPIWITTYNYRLQHLAHHQHTNDPELDPDYAYMSVCGHQYRPPMERGDFIRRCLIGPALAIPNQLRFLVIRLRLALLTGVMAKFRRPGSWVASAIFLGYLIVFLSGLGFVYFTDRPQMVWPWAGIVTVVTLVVLHFMPRNSLIEGSLKSYLNPRWATFGRLTYITLLFSGLVHLRLTTGLPFVMAYYLLWVFPLATTFSFLMVLREDIQHSHTLPGRFRNTRDAEVPWVMKWAVFPYGMDLHLAHHLYSMVPHYRLSELNQLLQTTTVYREHREVFGEELTA